MLQAQEEVTFYENLPFCPNRAISMAVLRIIALNLRILYNYVYFEILNSVFLTN